MIDNDSHSTPSQESQNFEMTILAAIVSSFKHREEENRELDRRRRLRKQKVAH